jgi:hypothetical protein
MPNTVRLHRVLATKPDKVYRAFIEADASASFSAIASLQNSVSDRFPRTASIAARVPTLARWPIMTARAWDLRR